MCRFAELTDNCYPRACSQVVRIRTNIYKISKAIEYNQESNYLIDSNLLSCERSSCEVRM